MAWRSIVGLTIAALGLVGCTGSSEPVDRASSPTVGPTAAAAPSGTQRATTTASATAPTTATTPAPTSAATPDPCRPADLPSGPPPALPSMAVPDDLVPVGDVDPQEPPVFDRPSSATCEAKPGEAAWAAAGISDYDLLVDLRSREWVDGGPVAGPGHGAVAQATVVLSVRDGALTATTQVDGDDLGVLLDPRRLTVDALLAGQGNRSGTPAVSTWCAVHDPRGVPEQCVTVPVQGAYGSRLVTVLGFAER